jgi:hypothetical protein
LNDEVIKTGVDDLLELLKGVSKISLSDAALKLGISTGLVQSWVDFLVEEEIIGIEYKFTKPMIYLNKNVGKSSVTVQAEAEFTMQSYKEEFWKRAAQRNIPAASIDLFWKNHLKEVVDSKRELFFREARKRKLENPDKIWDEYTKTILAS